MSQPSKSLFTHNPPTLTSSHTTLTSPSAVQSRPPLKRRFSEAAGDISLDGASSPALSDQNSLRNLRARAIYGLSQELPPTQEHEAPAKVQDSEFKTPALRHPLLDQDLLPGPGLKRAAPVNHSSRHRPPHKRIRLDRARHTADVLPGTQPSIHSPLFFSHNPLHPRPALPPRFSSSEAAAKMLSKAQGEEPSIKTVKLARGKLGSPPARPAPKSRYSSDRWSVARSTESPEMDHIVDQMSQIGVVEFLEQDERPTFIVDVADPHLLSGDGLQLLFANEALRSQPRLLAAVSGPSDEAISPLMDSAASFRSFKSWIFSNSPSLETPKRVPMKCLHAEISWSGSMLRKRLRVVSGIPVAETEHDSSTKQPLGDTAKDSSATATAQSNSAVLHETTGTQTRDGPRDSATYDYFGPSSAQSPAARSPAPAQGQSQVIPSIEEQIVSQDSLQQLYPFVERSALMSSERPGPNFSNTEYALEAVLSAASASDLDQFSGGERDMGFFDWTRLPASEGLPRHIQFARSVDWASTSLGPIETWSGDLRQMCNLIMASPHPAAMYWGEDLIAIYNEAYVLLAGQKHPTLMGQSYREAWSEIWDEVKDVFASAQQTGQATMKDDDCLFIKRNDFLEETYFSWSIIPMVGADGTVHGLYNPAFEKTRRKIAERRMLTLREVGERTAAAREVKGFWDEVLGALECNEHDTPFVLLYSLCDETDSEESSIYSNSVAVPRQCFLEGGLGVPKGHRCAPETADFASSNEGFLPYCREAAKSNRHKLFDVSKGELDPDLLEGLDWRGFGDAAKAVIVCPIHPTTGDSTIGFLILGVNPRRPYDDDYNLFIQLLSRQLATSLASVVLFEEEIRRGQKAAQLAALDRIQLSEQLAARTAEAIESETKFTRMAEFAPVGMFIADSSGRISYCNDTWYDITRVPKGDENTARWAEYVSDEDRDLVRSLWHDLVEIKKSVSAEFKFKAPWIDRNGVLGETWVLFSAFPEKDPAGKLKSVFGCITNISQQKWAEGFQKRKMEEAVELKRQQENFIDTTSHEMRNPLSAILQCSDEIVQSLTSAKANENEQHAGIDMNLLEETIDAAQTIALCAQHQKRIVDDVLTMSKLDSALLMVTPVDVQPLTVAQRALKMFENETQTADIELSFVVDQTFKDLDIDWVRFDPSRVLQVLINLTTNAIKFTTTETQRKIVVSLAASTTRPSSDSLSKVNFVPPKQVTTPGNTVSAAEWGTGELLYIQFAVEDTGRGLTGEEKKLLFMRFSQASPRTHVQYGGSGLGLFISRELTELQGGEIGVASEAGRGSTFAFYVMARRSTAPKGVSEMDIAALGRKPSAARGSDRSKGKGREPAVPASEKKLSRENSESSGRGKSSKAPLRVLIVEDNLVNQKVLQKQLRNMGCECLVANHGGEALQVLEKSWFWHEGSRDAHALDVVLMDQEMPVMDGLTCTKRIRELEAQGKFKIHVPIIAVTANARTEQIKTAMEAGMDDVMSKPFRITELIPKIEELMDKHSTDALRQK